MQHLHIIVIFAEENRTLMDATLKNSLFDKYMESSISIAEKENVLYDLNAMRDSFTKGVEVGESQFRWVSVKERLPEEEFDDGYTFVFVRVKTKIGYQIETDYIRNGQWELHQSPDKVVTHWMNIPVAGLEDVKDDDEIEETPGLQKIKTFYDLAEKIEPFDPPYTEDFQKYMEESIRQSRENAAQAELSAREIYIF